MPKTGKSQTGTIVIAIVILALGAVIYFVVSGQWGTKRFRGIEKFRGDRIEEIEKRKLGLDIDSLIGTPIR